MLKAARGLDIPERRGLLELELDRTNAMHSMAGAGLHRLVNKVYAQVAELVDALLVKSEHLRKTIS